MTVLISRRLPPPPSNFLPAGQVLWAEVMDTPPSFPNTKPRNEQQLKGLEYEEQAHEYLATRSEFYTPCPWLRYENANGAIRCCQPDGLFLNFVRGHCTVVEIKYSHTINAWYWLTQLYLPILKVLFQNWRLTFSVLEVCKRYDPSVPFPVQPGFIRQPELHFAENFGVHIFRPEPASVRRAKTR